MLVLLIPPDLPELRADACRHAVLRSHLVYQGSTAMGTADVCQKAHTLCQHLYDECRPCKYSSCGDAVHLRRFPHSIATSSAFAVPRVVCRRSTSARNGTQRFKPEVEVKRSSSGGILGRFLGSLPTLPTCSSSTQISVSCRSASKALTARRSRSVSLKNNPLRYS